MARTGGISTTVLRLTTALFVGREEKLPRASNANMLEKSDMARGATGRPVGTTQLLAACDVANGIHSSRYESIDELLHLIRKLRRRHLEHLIAFRTYDPNEKCSWRKSVALHLFAKKFF